MDALIVLMFALFGLVWGSFCNALASRMPLEESMAGRSRCPRCRHALAAHDLVPLVSYLLLLGRCRYCRHPISPRYPVVELASAVLFVQTYIHIGPRPLALLLYLSYATVVLLVAVIDFEHTIIPNRVVVPGMVLAFAAALLSIDPTGPSPVESLIGGVVGAAVFLLLHVLTAGRGMGMGDVKFALFMGLALGPLRLLPAVLCAALLSLVFAGVVMLGYRRELSALKSVDLDHGDDMEDMVIPDRIWGMIVIDGRPALPFGPFLAAGLWLSLLWGDVAVGWWLGLW